MAAILGTQSVNCWAEILDTGYLNFASPHGVEGLAKEQDGDLHILAIYSPNEGQGNCRNFLKAAQKAYKAVYVWDVFSPVLEAALHRYGFVPVEQREDGVVLTGFKFSTTES
jgi:hypothetical protein